tara:strand:- start:281 stop:1018 length:738 start_codon:yes stop_codon:yes gene_type:complete
MNLISIVLPVYNEENRIETCLKKIFFWISQKKKIKYEIIIVNDGSNDRTVFLINKINKILKLKIKIFNVNHSGQFFAICFGVKKSISNYPIIIEADLSTPLFYIDKFYKYVPGYDIITGSRFLKKSKIFNKPLYRKAISFFFLLFFKMMFKTKLSDPQLSFKIYNKKIFLNYSKSFYSKLDGMRSTEILIKFELGQKKIKEIPVEYTYFPSERNVKKSKIILLLLNCFWSLFTIWINLRIKRSKK